MRFAMSATFLWCDEHKKGPLKQAFLLSSFMFVNQQTLS
ncbi:hypothetical protein RVIR1_06940 [Candidatus Rickettsiella viridis]|uniref:Uncharacterized protein n=1 Tax=Candidatus Rickettsiella viridis TaxID=676208 RepID=A0A2Z5UVY0_9COXI|nr:hypothetical protein RVIR1_06940 [Candidatus Rickettsiella viridis]